VRGGRLARWFGRPMRWLSFLAGGAIAILVFPAPSLSYVAWFGLLPAMVLFTRAATTREAAWRGWWFGAGYIIAMLYWMAPEIGPGLVLVGGVAGCLYSPFAMSVRKLLKPRPELSWRRCALAFIVVPACWVIPEWARSYQGLGGPWDLYGASQWQHPAVLALAAVGGVWLVSVALIMANVGLFILLTAGWSRRVPFAAFGLVAFAVAAGAGPLAFALTPPFPAVRSATISLVQPGLLANPVAQADASETLTRSLTGPEALGGKKPDLIVWGESSIDADLTLPSSRPLLKQIETLAAETGAEILVSQDATPPGKGHEKWAVLVGPTGIKGIYVKTRLVPFGEYIPFRQALGWLTFVSRAAGSNMTPGTGAHLLPAVSRSGQPLPIGVLICFESAFPDMSRVDADLGAQVIVYQSSTVTFQGTWGPDQHGSLAALRAAETGRPVVQAALTGDSVAFDARGRELAWMGQSAHGVITVQLGLPSGSARTFYDQYGDYVMWACVAISALAGLVMLARRKGFLGGTAGAADGDAAEYEADTGQPVAS
jgi:apolipoprotein N-acyltransferase